MSAAARATTKRSNIVYISPNWEPYTACTAVNWGCKHDSVSLSPSLSRSSVVTWSSALLDGKILDLVCSGDSTQPSKVIQGGFFEGRSSLYPATLPATHFFMSGRPIETCTTYLLLFEVVCMLKMLFVQSHLISVCSVGFGLKSKCHFVLSVCCNKKLVLLLVALFQSCTQLVHYSAQSICCHAHNAYYNSKW